MAEIPRLEEWSALVEFVRARPEAFLRFSEGPAADRAEPRSRDYEANVELPGLSVTTISPEPWWPRPDEDWIARRLCKYADLGEEDDRYPWLLSGTQAGRGPDHEPLVVDWEPLARIGHAVVLEAERRYRERFDVGQDSR